jgi:hypothetical protein
MFWGTPNEEVQKMYDEAHLVMDTLVRGGMTELEAKSAIERLWVNARFQGYEDGSYDSASEN